MTMPKQQPEPAPKRPEPKEDVPGQPNEPPKDEPDELIRRFYTGGLPREEFAARMKALGKDVDWEVPPAIPASRNPDPTQPGADAAAKFPGATHRL